jgi:hypothetical protein
MFRKLLVTVIVLLAALLFVDMSADVLQAWAVKEHSEREQGRLIRTHWVDQPHVGMLG